MTTTGKAATRPTHSDAAQAAQKIRRILKRMGITATVTTERSVAYPHGQVVIDCLAREVARIEEELWYHFATIPIAFVPRSPASVAYQDCHTPAAEPLRETPTEDMAQEATAARVEPEPQVATPADSETPPPADTAQVERLAAADPDYLTSLSTDLKAMLASEEPYETRIGSMAPRSETPDTAVSPPVPESPMNRKPHARILDQVSADMQASMRADRATGMSFVQIDLKHGFLDAVQSRGRVSWRVCRTAAPGGV